MPPPNILLITADQLRADVLGCYGNRHCRTPNLDALASGGVVFENGLTPTPICVPARASLTTGNYPMLATGVKNNGGRIRDDQVALAAHFAAAGYETYACGKLHYTPYAPPGAPRLLHGFQHGDLSESGRLATKFDPTGRQRGLEDYLDFLEDAGWGGYSRAHGVGNNDIRPCPTPLPAELHVDHWVADCTIRRLRDHRASRHDQPFLIWCSFPKPHAPLDPPHAYAAAYDPRSLPPPVGDASMLATRNPHLEATRYTHALPTLSPAAWQVIRAYYYGLMTFQDEQVGRVLASLRDVGCADNTVVVYTADHGDLLGDFGSCFKTNFLRGSGHVPFLWKGPGIPAGERRRQLAGLQDILPTLASLAERPLPRPVQGLDLVPALRSPSAEGREVYYGTCCDAPGQTAMLFDGRWKYLYSQQGPTEELYDLEADPDERVNLAVTPDGRARLPDWRSRLIGEARRWGDTTLLEGEALATAPLDRSRLAELPVRGMGWRWA